MTNFVGIPPLLDATGFPGANLSAGAIASFNSLQGIDSTGAAVNAFNSFQGSYTAIGQFANYQVADNQLLPVDPATGVWGLYDDSNTPVLVADSVLAFGYHNDSKVSDFPLENGAFATYNKVATPYEAVIRLGYAGKSEADRGIFLAKAQAIASSDDLNLYTIITPEITYTNANVDDIEYQRTEKEGAHILIVNLRIREIRVATNPQYKTAAGVTPLPAAQVKNPGSADIISGGQVQAVAATSGVTAAIGDLNPFAAVNL